MSWLKLQADVRKDFTITEKVLVGAFSLINWLWLWILHKYSFEIWSLKRIHSGPLPGLMGLRRAWTASTSRPRRWRGRRTFASPRPTRRPRKLLPWTQGRRTSLENLQINSCSLVSKIWYHTSCCILGVLSEHCKTFIVLNLNCIGIYDNFDTKMMVQELNIDIVSLISDALLTEEFIK